MKTLITFFLISFSLSSGAQTNACSAWIKESSVSCIFAGRSTTIWKRNCQETCTWRDRNPACNQERICLDQNPNSLKDECSEWVLERSVTCRNDQTGDWEKKWIRACQTNRPTSICMDQNPNY